MSFDEDARYFADQATKHDQMAEQATNSAARIAHLELGRRYAAKAIELDPRRSSTSIGFEGSVEHAAG